jgi:hypothetical protein
MTVLRKNDTELQKTTCNQLFEMSWSAAMTDVISLRVIGCRKTGRDRLHSFRAAFKQQTLHAHACVSSSRKHTTA